MFTVAIVSSHSDVPFFLIYDRRRGTCKAACAAMSGFADVMGSADKLTAGERILEDLLKAQELQDREVDSWVETETALVWAEGAVELDTIALVDLWLEVVVLPNDAELDDALWDGNNLEGGLVLWVLLEERGVLEGGCEL